MFAVFMMMMVNLSMTTTGQPESARCSYIHMSGIGLYITFIHCSGVCVHACVCVRPCAHMYLCVCVHAYVFVCARAHVCLYVFVCICVCVI